MLSQTQQLVQKFYKDSKGNPFLMKPTQDKIFSCIFKRQAPDGKRNIHVLAHTRYGKSDVIAMGVLSRVTTFPEKWYIISGDEEKTQIIMSYIIGHIGDNEYTRHKFNLEKGDSYDRIRRQRSRKKVTFKVDGHGSIGEIETLSTQESRNINQLDATLGKGAPNIILDESSLIGNMGYTGVLRMLGDWPDPFICEIGNAVRRNHFYEASIDPSYHRIVADWRLGLVEGRITQEQIDRMRANTDDITFGILYDCIFPPPEQMDSEGWVPYLTGDQYDICRRVIQSTGVKRMGVDVGEGGSPNVFVIRTDNRAWVESTDYEADPMKTADKVRKIITENMIEPKNVAVDTTGPGLGVASRLHQLRVWVQAVKNGAKARDPDSYVNIKSECYRELQKWMLEGGTLQAHQFFDAMLNLKFRTVAKNKWEMVPKIKLFSWGFQSPHGPEALALTFAMPTAFITEKSRQQERKPDQFPANAEYDIHTGVRIN